jgi:uncharacterized membrane protein YfcA
MALSIGLVIGLLLGLTGAGGSVLAVPLLLLGLRLPPQEAMGISLGAVAASALVGVISRLKSGDIAWAPALIFAATGMLAAPVGRFTGAITPQLMLQAVFTVLAVGIAVKMWLQASKTPEATREVRAGKNAPAELPTPICQANAKGALPLNPRCIVVLGASGLFAGFLSGYLGVGGGFVVVPLLMSISQITMRQAVGTSLVIITLVSTVGFGTYLMMDPKLPLSLFLWIVGGGLLGMLLGTAIAGKIAGPTLQKGFSVAVIILALISIVDVANV